MFLLFDYYVIMQSITYLTAIGWDCHHRTIISDEVGVAMMSYADYAFLRNKYRAIMKSFEGTGPAKKADDNKEDKKPAKPKAKAVPAKTTNKRKAPAVKEQVPSASDAEEIDEPTKAKAEDDAEEVAAEPSPKKKRKTAAAKPKKSAITVNSDAEDNDAVKKPAAAKPRGRGVKAKQGAEAEKNEDVATESDAGEKEEPAQKPAAKGRGKATKARKDTEADGVSGEDGDVAVSDAEEKKETRGKSAVVKPKVRGKRAKDAEEGNATGDKEEDNSGSDAEVPAPTSNARGGHSRQAPTASKPFDAKVEVIIPSRASARSAKFNESSKASSKHDDEDKAVDLLDMTESEAEAAILRGAKLDEDEI